MDNPTKACTSCRVVFPATLAVFPPHKHGKYGLHSLCRPCKKKQDAERRARPDQKARQQAWRDANKDRVKATNEAYRAKGYTSTEAVRRWRSLNIEHARKVDREKQARYRREMPDVMRARARKYAERNRQKITASSVLRSKVRYRTDAAFNIKSRVSARMRKMLFRVGGKHAGTEKLLGYSRHELLSHLVSRFSPGMTVEALLGGKIHIDHIRPVRSFNIVSEGDAEFVKCWSLDNLQPLWAIDNWRKGGRV